MPRQWKGGRDAAQQRYKAKHRAEINARSRARYAANPRLYRERQRLYRQNPENYAKMLAYSLAHAPAYRRHLRAEMVEAYGSRCECCGETEVMFLHLDHIDGGGAAERKKGLRGQKFLNYLKRNGWPRDRYRLLCANCNLGRERNGGVCPHKAVKNME